MAAYPGVKRIIVTESGCAEKDKLVQGRIDDQLRISYFQQYLSAIYRAKSEGVPIDGYLVWTLTDNFEWAYGYTARFGLVRVDFPTQLRTIKESGYWFRSFLNNMSNIS
jgi:beta-glucosidase